MACDINCHTCKQQRRNKENGESRVIPVLAAEAIDPSDWRLPYIEYLENGRLTGETTVTQRQQIAIRSRPYILKEDKTLMKEGPDGIRRRCVAGPLTTAIITEAHEEIAGGHFSANLTLHKILTALYWWPTMKKDVYLYCKWCDICQRVGPKISKGVQPMNPLMPT